MKTEGSAWDSPRHLETFTDFRKDLPLYRRFRNKKIFHNFGRCIAPALVNSTVVNEIGVGGGRTYKFVTQLIQERQMPRKDLKGYDVSQACVDSCNNYFGDLFQVVSSEDPDFRECDLLYFFDVLVHSHKPLEFLDAVSDCTTKFLCLQTPTRDVGATEFDMSKSCRLENGIWIPWIVFNLDELLEELRKRGFVKFLIAKSYKDFSRGDSRRLPREFSKPNFPASRTALLAIKSAGLCPVLEKDTGLEEKEISFMENEEVRVPRWLAMVNQVWRTMGS